MKSTLTTNIMLIVVLVILIAIVVSWFTNKQSVVSSDGKTSMDVKVYPFGIGAPKAA